MTERSHTFCRCAWIGACCLSLFVGLVTGTLVAREEEIWSWFKTADWSEFPSTFTSTLLATLFPAVAVALFSHRIATAAVDRVAYTTAEGNKRFKREQATRDRLIANERLDALAHLTDVLQQTFPKGGPGSGGPSAQELKPWLSNYLPGVVDQLERLVFDYQTDALWLALRVLSKVHSLRFADYLTPEPTGDELIDRMKELVAATSEPERVGFTGAVSLLVDRLIVVTDELSRTLSGHSHGPLPVDPELQYLSRSLLQDLGGFAKALRPTD